MAEELWNIIQIASAGIITLGGAGTIIVALVKWAHKPATDRDDRIKRHDEMFDNDNRRLKELEKARQDTDEAINVLMQSMLAMMSNAIDGNHKEELKIARDDLQKYLIKRR